MLKFAATVLIFLGSSLIPLLGQAASGPSLQIAGSFSKDWARKPQSGSLYLIVSTSLVGEPRSKVGSWDSPPWIFRRDVRDLKPGEDVIFDRSAPGYPGRLDQIPPGHYGLQLVFDRNLDDPDFINAHNNGRSRLKRRYLDPQSGDRISLEVDTLISRAPLRDLPRVRYRKIESRNIGRHLGRRHFVTVSILVPEGYQKARDAGATFDVQYWLPGLGIRARGGLKFFQERGLYFGGQHAIEGLPPVIRVLIDGHGPTGHHYWVDSPNNGSYQEALIKEIIPAIEDEFAIRKSRDSRYLVGHGAGGWAAVNLLSKHPTFFRAAVALAPDPLDFRSAFGMNLSAPRSNAFRNAAGKEFPFAQRNGKVVLTLADQARYESVVKRGGVLRSFETSFGPAGGGELFDRQTGAFKTNAVRTAFRHDIMDHIRANFGRDRKYLDAGIRIAVGENDDFFLTKPTLDFAFEYRQLNSLIQCVSVPKLGHRELDLAPLHRLAQKDLTFFYKSKTKTARSK